MDSAIPTQRAGTEIHAVGDALDNVLDPIMTRKRLRVADDAWAALVTAVMSVANDADRFAVAWALDRALRDYTGTQHRPPCGAPNPADAVPIQMAPESGAATVNIAISEDVPTDRLFGVLESVKGVLAGRPGPLRVVLSLSRMGGTRQVMLPDRVAWDERLGEIIRRAAGVPVRVELRHFYTERNILESVLAITGGELLDIV